MQSENILIYLPSPMGDAVMATPALKALRKKFRKDKIIFCANSVVKQVLSPTDLADGWLEVEKNPFKMARKLKAYNFSTAILFKNSFAAAAAVFLAKIPARVGYARDCRGVFLTEKLYPKKKSLLKYAPLSVIDYYLNIASWFGCQTEDKKLSLQIDDKDIEYIEEKFAQQIAAARPLFIIVPGGAFGASKIWPAENFAKTADALIEKYNAFVFVSTSPNQNEMVIAEKIKQLAKYSVMTAKEFSLSLGQLKALFSMATLVVGNDTGPRHIAIALGKKIITLFGPNNPKWTENNYEDEIKIVADVKCAPCDKPKCKEKKHYCMLSIKPQMLCDAADKLLAKELL